MRKTLKLILCMLLAAAMVMSFAACDKEKKKGSDDKIVTPEEEAKETVDDFMSALCEYELKDAAKYLSDDAFDEVGDPPFDGLDDMKTEFNSMLVVALQDVEVDASKIKKAADAMGDAFADKTDYEIKDYFEKDGVYTFEVEFEYVNGDVSDFIAEAKEKSDTVDDYLKYITKNIEDIGTKKDKLDIVVEEIDGEWLITEAA